MAFMAGGALGFLFKVHEPCMHVLTKFAAHKQNCHCALLTAHLQPAPEPKVDEEALKAHQALEQQVVSLRSELEAAQLEASQAAELRTQLKTKVCFCVCLFVFGLACVFGFAAVCGCRWSRMLRWTPTHTWESCVCVRVACVCVWCGRGMRGEIYRVHRVLAARIGAVSVCVCV